MYISEHQWILEGDERRFMESKWLCVLSQYVPEINVGNINQCVVCGGGIGIRFMAILLSVESLSKTRLQVR